MAQSDDEFEKHDEESDPLDLDKFNDFIGLRDYGCITVAQCAIIASLTVQRREVTLEVTRVITHYRALAFLEIEDGELNSKHPVTLISYCAYQRMRNAGMCGPDGADMPVVNSSWLIPLDEAKRWLQSKDLHFDFDLLKTSEEETKGESKPALVSSVHDWQTEAKKIADELFDHDTKADVRGSLDWYSKRVMEEMQKKGVRGPRGIMNNPNTIKRHALQGEKWWGKKLK